MVCSNTNQNGLILLNDEHTYISKLLNGIHVYLILFNLFPVSDSLFNFSRIDILWPASLNMVNTTTLCFKPFCIDLKQGEGVGVRGLALIKLWAWLYQFRVDKEYWLFNWDRPVEVLISFKKFIIVITFPILISAKYMLYVMVTEHSCRYRYVSNSNVRLFPGT